AIIAVILGIYLLPSPIDPEPFIFEKPPPALIGPLQVNQRLHQAQRLFSGLLKGPESFAADSNGDVYTGTVDGKLWRIHDNQLTFVAQMGQDVSGCGSFESEALCGRPHGVRFDKDGYLIVADSYYGLYRVHPLTGEKSLLVSNSEGADGILFKFLNGLEIAKNGTIFFTDSSSKWGCRHHRYEVIEANHMGRLLAYDSSSQKVRMVLDGLYMANGLALSPDEDYILIAETSVCRIIRYWLKGPKTGTKEIFADNLPGYPDNIRQTKVGTYRVGLTTTRLSSYIRPFLDILGPYPMLKRIVVTPLSFYTVFLHKYGLLLELNDRGQIVDSFHDPNGTVTWAISDAFENNGKLYLGSTDLPFLVVLELPD
uniref:Zgc:194209 n=1 Tax=Callorhinchus milii TaxID=7868 RepID=A0A4W3I4S1_CALMI